MNAYLERLQDTNFADCKGDGKCCPDLLLWALICIVESFCNDLSNIHGIVGGLL